MDPTIWVALIAASAVIGAAWIANRRTHGAVRRIESEFSPNHGSSAKDALNRIEQNQQHLIGRFDQHVSESAADKTSASIEARAMWEAIAAVAHSTPPKENP